MGVKKKTPSASAAGGLDARVKKIQNQIAELKKQLGGRKRGTDAAQKLKLARTKAQLRDARNATQPAKQAQGTTEAQTQTDVDNQQKTKIEKLQADLQQLEFQQAIFLSKEATDEEIKKTSAKYINDLQNYIQELQAKAPAAATQSAEIKKLQDALKKSKIEQAKFIDKSAQDKQLQEQNAKAIKDLEDKLAAAATQTAKLDDKKAALQNLQQKLDTITQERDSAIQERDAVKSTNSTKNSATQTAALRRTSSRLASQTDLRKQLDDLNKDLEDERKQTKRSASDQEKLVESLKKKQKQSEQDCEKEKKRLKKELKKAEEKNAELIKKLTGAEKACEEEKKRLKEELKKSEQRIAELTKELADARKDQPKDLTGLQDDIKARVAKDLAEKGKDTLPSWNDPLPIENAKAFNQIFGDARTLVEGILDQQEAAILNHVKTNPNSAYTFRSYLHDNPDLVERNAWVDESVLVASVLNRYLYQRVFVTTRDLYPDLAGTIEGMKTVQQEIWDEKKSDQWVKLWTGYWFHCIYSDATFDATREKVADAISNEIAQLLAFAADVVGRPEFVARVKKEVVLPAMRLNEHFEASASYWDVQYESPADVQDAIDGADGDALYDVLSHHQFTNISDTLRNFNYDRMAQRLKLPPVPVASYVGANFDVLSTIAPKLTLMAPDSDGIKFQAPAVVVGQRMLISWAPPGTTRKDGATTELAKLLIADHAAVAQSSGLSSSS